MPKNLQEKGSKTDVDADQREKRKAIKKEKRESRVHGEKLKSAANDGKVFPSEHVALVKTYVRDWGRHQEDASIPWKFHRKTQERLMSMVFEKQYVGSKLFETACAYLSESKGGVRARLVMDSRALITKHDAATEEERETQPELRKMKRRAEKVLAALGE